MHKALSILFFAQTLLSSGSEISFNRDVRPILSENCFLCHGQDPEHRGAELRLDIREEAIAVRDSGAAIVPGDADSSLLIQRILSTDPDDIMPPPKAHLPDMESEQIAILKQWINDGAEYEVHWSFVKPTKKSLPKDSANPVDAFVQKRLKEEGLQPSPPAPIETQLRRLHLDLTGLPPSLEEMEAFLTDPSPDRWNRRIEKLMTSPHFAERLATPWLDLARYGDTHGFSIDDHRDMWAWRDWVIHSFMENKPYDEFLRYQVAGDLIPDASPDQIAATGFLRNSMGTHEGGTIPEEYRVIQVVDKVDAVATSMLGLTMKCAQCHDHKYDPISHKEYFQFYAFFNTSSEPGESGTNSSTKPVMHYRSPLGDGGMSGLKDRVSELEYLKAHPSAEIIAARESWEANSQEPIPELQIPVSERTLDQWNTINQAFVKADHQLSKLAAITIKTIDVELGVLKPDLERGKTTVMVMDYDPSLRKTYILERGAYDQYGEEVTTGTPKVLNPLEPAEETATRLDLAHWITNEENPLTARVAVNHLWQMIFGKGLVETAGDFGNQGSWPSHPELLDWLAVDLMENDWNLRESLKTILTSNTYRQSAKVTPESLEKDPRAVLLSRSPRTRLEAEFIRDQALELSGLLNRKLGGPGVFPPQPDLWSEISHFGYQKPFTSQKFFPGSGESTLRRSIYTFWKRTSPPPSMALFDAPTRETCTATRSATNTPLQALVTLNDPQYVRAANAFGQRMISEGGETAEDRLEFGFRLATGREPNSTETSILKKALQRHLSRYQKDPQAAENLVNEKSPELAAFSMVAATLLNLDEVISRP